MTLTAERLRELLHYDPATGVFTWKVNRGNNKKTGKIAGSVHHYSGGRKYLHVMVCGRHYQAHRLAFLWMTSAWPPNDMDHKDGDGLNNRWNNLRPATDSQNGANRRKDKRNTTGFKGVTKYYDRFQAQIIVNRKMKYLGTFDTPEQAHAAYCVAAVKYFGEFARTA